MRAAAHRGPAHGRPAQRVLESLPARVSRGDREAFEALRTAVAGSVPGLARRVVRDRAQSEEVAREVLIDVWRCAARFDPRQGGALAWIMTLTHRRAVDRVRSVQAAADREVRAGSRDHAPAFDEVSERVEQRLEREQVRRCLQQLTGLPRESVTLAHYRGSTCQQTAEVLGAAPGTVRTRLRDGLIRLRDCLGVSS
ncbi:ECF RNA polymerase sigma factor SigK [Actinacidiphila rubida]|uniref:RNA polymerase sigma-70 factor, ECF subfamily n=1 Tax=Actinacidiphila rubida TaxID=310780 RepID=A0A1H8JKM1_9ACTN|nr:ECF RNA polymerase sigma factor SigK [Actinacidiphila rubida]SEN80876.1 RNA polymerase sigma-70 factor, ECF subfamily [Actinacidiphila rubida]